VVADCQRFISDHFNALQYARQLEATGVTKNQAEVHANNLAQVLDNYVELNELKREVGAAVSATEARLRAEISASEARLEAKIAKTESALRTEIAGVETRLHAEIAGVETRPHAEIAGVETRPHAEIQTGIQSLRAEITRLRWGIGTSIALSIAILAQGYFR
jgi:hypothetical protein